MRATWQRFYATLNLGRFAFGIGKKANNHQCKQGKEYDSSCGIFQCYARDFQGYCGYKVLSKVDKPLPGFRYIHGYFSKLPPGMGVTGTKLVKYSLNISVILTGLQNLGFRTGGRWALKDKIRKDKWLANWELNDNPFSSQGGKPLDRQNKCFCLTSYRQVSAYPMVLYFKSGVFLTGRFWSTIVNFYLQRGLKCCF